MRQFFNIITLCSLLALTACPVGVSHLQIDKIEPEQAAVGETVQVFLSSGEFEPETNTVFVGEQQAEVAAAPGLAAEETGVVDIETGLVGEAEQAEENAITIRIPETAAPGQVFIRVLGDNFASNQFPFTVLAEGGELAEGAPEAGTEKTAVEPVCDWSGSTFSGNDVYKGETVAQQDLSTELYWTIEGEGDCGKFKVIVETAPGVITEFKDDQAQSGKLTIDKQEEDTTYKLIIVQKGQAVHQLTETVDVVTIEEDFKVSVEVINNKTGTETVLLQPEDNYDYQNTWKSVYKFDSRLEKLCVRSPEFGVEPPQAQLKMNPLWKYAHAISNLFIHEAEAGPIITIDKFKDIVVQKKAIKWKIPPEILKLFDNWPKFPKRVSKEKCFTPQNSQIDADGNYYVSNEDFPFPNVNGGKFSTDVEYYAVYKGNPVFIDMKFPVTVAVLKPSIDLKLAQAIQGKVEDEEKTDPLGWESPWSKLEIDAHDASAFYVVMPATTRLYSKAVNFANPSNQDVELEAECFFGGLIPGEIDYQGVCARQGFAEEVLKRFSHQHFKKTLRVFRFDANDVQDTYYMNMKGNPSKVYDPKVIVFAYGSGDYKDHFVTSQKHDQLPKPEFSSASCNKNQVFKSQSVSFGLDSKAWVVGAVGEPTVESNDLDSIAPSFSAPPDTGDGYYDINFSANYKGMNPWFKIKAKGILGDTHTFTCEWGETIKDWPIWVTLENGPENTPKGKVSLKASLLKGSGPAPYTHWKIVGDEGCSGADLNEAKTIDYAGSTQSSPQKGIFQLTTVDSRTFTIDNIGVDCWKAKLQLKYLDNKWHTRKFKGPQPADSVKKKGYAWISTDKKEGNWGVAMAFPPKMEFEVVPWEKKYDKCYGTCNYDDDKDNVADRCDGEWCLYSYQGQFVMNGDFVKSISADCNSGSLHGYEIETHGHFDHQVIKHTWSTPNGRRKFSKTFKCTLTARGPGQTITQDFELTCPAATTYDDADAVAVMACPPK